MCGQCEELDSCQPPMRDWGAFKTMHIISVAAQVDGARLELMIDGMAAAEKMWLIGQLKLGIDFFTVAIAA